MLCMIEVSAQKKVINSLSITYVVYDWSLSTEGGHKQSLHYICCVWLKSKHGRSVCAVLFAVEWHRVWRELQQSVLGRVDSSLAISEQLISAHRWAAAAYWPCLPGTVMTYFTRIPYMWKTVIS